MTLSTNTRVGTPTNLQPGGSYDLLMVTFKDTFPEGQIGFDLYNTPMKITGLQKVAQIFLKTLLTSKGSDPFNPDRGTVFPQLTVNANRTLDDVTLLADIRDSVADCVAQVQNYLNVSIVDTSSALDTVEVLGLDAVEEGIVLYLHLTTLAGELAAVAVPFPEFGLD